MAQTIKLKRSGTSGRLPTTSDLELGEVAINTYDGKMYIKKNVGGTESIVEIGGQGGGIASSFTLYEYTATASQTTFSGSDSNSNTLAYDTGTPPKILVYLNGVLLDHTTDYTATNGTSVVLTSAAAASDLVQIAAYKSSVSTTLDIDLSDNQKLLLGDDDDLELYHSGTHSYIRDSGTGRLYITSNNLRVTNSQGSETILDAYEDGRVDLYYDNSKKFATTSTGVDVTGALVADSGQIDGNFVVDTSTLYVDSTNNRVGIGTTSPNYSLDVVSSGGGINIGGTGAYLRWNSGDIQIKNEGSYKMGFYTYNSSDAALNRHMVIDTNGYVGIGTASPGVELDIKRHTNAYPLRVSSEGGQGRAIVFADVASTPTKYNWIAGTQYNINDSFEITPSTAVGGYTFSNPALAILPDGKVGIGTTTPDSKLTVNVTSNSDGIELQSSETKIATLSRTAVNSQVVASLDGVASRPIHIGGIVNEDVILANAGGNVGIGTASPASLLNVYTDAGRDFRVDHGTANRTILSTDRGMIVKAGAGYSLDLDTGSASGTIRFLDNGTAHSAFDASGNLGIGTTTPSQKLDVEGLIRSGGIAHPEIELVPTGSVGNADIRFDGTSLDIRSNSSGAYLTLQTATTERLKITNTGNFEFNNGNFTEVGTISSGAITSSASVIASGNSNSFGNTTITNLSATSVTASGSITASGNSNSFGNITTTGYLRGPSTFTIDPATHGDNTGTVVIAGNLQVDGTTTTINSTTLTVDDLNITLASGSANSAAANGAGITVDIANNTNPTLLYNGTLDTWEFNKRVDVTSEVRLFRSDGARSGSLLHNTSGTVLRTNSNGDNLYLQTAGTGNVYLQPSTAGYSTVVNEDGIDSDFRVESDGNTHAFFVDAGNSRLGINTSSLTADGLIIGTNNSNCELDLHNTGGSGTRWRFNSSAYGHLQIENKTDSTIPFTIRDNGRVGIGITSPDEILQINSADSAIRVNTTNAVNNSELQLLYNNSSNGMIFRYHGNSALAYIDNTYPRTQGQSYGDILFRQNYAGTMTEHMRLTAYDGFLGIGTNTPKAKLQVEVAGIDTTTTSTTATTQVAIDTFAAATFRSARYTIQVTNSTDSTYHLTEILLIHDGTTPQITEYGTIFTGSAEATFDADISNGNVRLLATPATTDSMTFKVVRHCITV